MPGYAEVLVEQASALADKIRDNVSQNNLPSVISDAIEIGDVQQDESAFWIDVSVNITTAPMAAAFEFGSGEHAPSSPSRYRIPNEGNDGVAFPEERWPGVINPEALPRLPDGRFIFRFVMHPGVEARPYIKPAVVEITPKIREQVGAAAKVQILTLYGNPQVVISA